MAKQKFIPAVVAAEAAKGVAMQLKSGRDVNYFELYKNGSKIADISSFDETEWHAINVRVGSNYCTLKQLKTALGLNDVIIVLSKNKNRVGAFYKFSLSKSFSCSSRFTVTRT